MMLMPSLLQELKKLFYWNYLSQNKNANNIKKNFARVLKLAFLTVGCYQLPLENNSVQRRNGGHSEDESEHDPCIIECPFCSSLNFDHIIPIKKVGIIQFLVDSFMEEAVH